MVSIGVFSVTSCLTLKVVFFLLVCKKYIYRKLVEDWKIRFNPRLVSWIFDFLLLLEIYEDNFILGIFFGDDLPILVAIKCENSSGRV